MSKRKKPVTIIISISSDIGTAMARRWVKNGWDIYGTYRTNSDSVKELSEKGVKLIHCDLKDNDSVNDACREIRSMCPSWDNLILAPGTQEPIGPFVKCDFDEWTDSIQVNFINQLRIVHELLPTANRDNKIGSCVLFFAGGGTNNATVNYSAYTISKISLIKMCELLDAEINDVRFAIVGPGWVKTKIHMATIEAGDIHGSNYIKTLDRFQTNNFTPMENVLDCCEWVMNTPRNVISGRNFSVVFDKWGTTELTARLLDDFDMYKLRRKGN